MPLPILQNPDPRLRERAQEVDLSTEDPKAFQVFLADLEKTMYAADGIGIAAPQVGVSKRAIVVGHGHGAAVYLNPRIVSASWRKMDSQEGCLSVPGVYGVVRRHRRVRVEAQTPDGKDVTVDAEGLLSAIFQHEIDHLNGILFIDRLPGGRLSRV